MALFITSDLLLTTNFPAVDPHLFLCQLRLSLEYMQSQQQKVSWWHHFSQKNNLTFNDKYNPIVDTDNPLTNFDDGSAGLIDINDDDSENDHDGNDGVPNDDPDFTDVIKSFDNDVTAFDDAVEEYPVDIAGVEPNQEPAAFDDTVPTTFDVVEETTNNIAGIDDQIDDESTGVGNTTPLITT